jgi:hypothetical protein
MAIVATILVILHFIGLSYLLGSFLVEIKDVIRGQGRVMRGMLDGALLQLITGIALVGIYSAGLVEGEEVNNSKVAVKLSVAIVVYVLALVFRKRVPAPSWALWAIGGLTLTNVIIAVSW